MHRLIALLCWVLMAAMPPLAAQTTIHRCVGGNGNPVFADQPCAALDATPLARPAQPSYAGVDIPIPAVLCAANMGELRRGVIEAFANRDANRMAGLMLWGGYGRTAAVADIRALQGVMRESLLDVESPQAGGAGPPAVAGGASANPLDFDRPAWDGAPPPAPNKTDTLVLHTSGPDGSGPPREMRYAVVRRSGCLWLRSAN